MGVNWGLLLLLGGLTIVSGDIIPKKFLEKHIAAHTKINTTSVTLFQHEHKKRNTSFVNLPRSRNVTVADSGTICTYFHSVPNISDKCRTQLEILCEIPSLLMTLLDASGKFPYTGLGYASRLDYGNFDQCLTVDHTYSGGRILGEYCTVGLVVPNPLGNLSDVNTYFKVAQCRPDACVASDYNAVLENLTSVSLEVFVDIACITVESNTELNTGDIATLSVFGVIIMLMVLSTVYDMFLYFIDSKSLHPLLLSFSVLSNGRKLLHISRHSQSKQQIEPFHGIRVISMMWIVAGHGFVMWQYIPVTNAETVAKWQKEIAAFYITAAPLAVDTFFFMSGFLLAFQYFKGKTKTLTEQLADIPRGYIHRYLRLTPAMVMVYVVTITFFIRIGSGPLWMSLSQNNIDVCKAHWWQFMFYIQNYADSDDICLIQTWYLSADMQLFLLSPLVLIPLSLQLKKYGLKVVMVEFLIWNIFWTFLPMITKLVFSDNVYYYDTHSRAINYFIGMMLGVFMRVKIDEPFLNIIDKRSKPIINLIIWHVVVLSMLAIIFSFRDGDLYYGYKQRAVFESLMRPAWCIGLSWITYSCYHGHGGIVNWILCRPVFQVLGKLTYCIYLTHMATILYFVATVRTKWHFSDYEALYTFCGHYIVTLMLATFWTLAFESPVLIIEKYLLGGGRKSKEPSQTASNEQPKKAT